MAAVSDADGRIGNSITTCRLPYEDRRSRAIPMHPRVGAALVDFQNAHPGVEFRAFAERGTIQRWRRKQNISYNGMNITEVMTGDIGVILLIFFYINPT